MVKPLVAIVDILKLPSYSPFYMLGDMLIYILSGGDTLLHP